MPKKSNTYRRRLPIGAEPVPGGGVHFRVWAPIRRKVEVVLEKGPEGTASGGGTIAPFQSEKNGYFSALVPDAGEGSYYRFRLDGSDRLLPDPASRFQPNGPFGASLVVSPETFEWTDGDWPGIKMAGQVIYEMHVGTFTQEGTWEAASRELPELKELGVTLLEIMPVADFPGRFGWGYDGVNLFAPTRLYGHPDDFRRFVDAAHGCGVGVILDVVYNHLGPNGNMLREFSPDYFTDRYEGEWGEPINFDGDNSGSVREFYLANVRHWFEEYHVDGLRLDAVQGIHDCSDPHIVREIVETGRRAAGKRSVAIIAENEAQQVRLLKPTEEGGYGLDAVWNDDFHHSAMVALTGHNEAYYTDYLASPQEFVSLAKYGFLYQGQLYKWQGKRRGSPTFGLPRWAFVNFLQNHDQIANSGKGLRCHLITSPGRYKALTALLLLGPGTPMLFQGQEFAATTPFFYFADHPEEVAVHIQQGRTEFLRQFRSLAVPEIQARLPDPVDPSTFVRCKLNAMERQEHAHYYQLHRDLLNLRRHDSVLSQADHLEIDGAVLGPEAFVLRYFGPEQRDRLIVVNIGRDLHLDPAPEPLLAPPEGSRWRILWSSEDPKYNGSGTAPLDSEENWWIPGSAAVVLYPDEEREEQEDAH